MTGFWPTGRVRWLLAAGALALGLLPVTAAGAQPLAPQARIVGGTQATTGAWPAHAGILSSAVPDNYQAQYCGGTVINRLWVLTAAHCMFDESGRRMSAAQIDVLVGTQSLDAGGTRIRVQETRIIPGWNPDTYDRDIAMLRLSKPTTVPNQVLTTQGAQVPTGAEVVAIGWGNQTEGTNDYPTELRQVTLYQQPDGNCAAAYGSAFHASTMRCESAAGKDTCAGDSGGPLVTRRNGTWVQVAITSWGEGCAQPGYPSVSTRLPNFGDWIRQQINPPPGGRATVSAALSTASSPVGSLVTLRGKVTPMSATKRVIVQRKVGGRWLDRDTATVDQGTGEFVVRMRPSQPGNYTLRVRSNGGTVVSRTVVLTARMPRPGQPCTLGSFPDCIDPDGDGRGEYLIGGADCMATIGTTIGPGICSDLDRDGHAGYYDAG